MFDPEYRPGDNLFTNSSIALDLATGKIKPSFRLAVTINWRNSWKNRLNPSKFVAM